MPIVAIPRRNMTAFERKYFFEDETPERTNVRKISISDEGNTQVNGQDASSDDVDIEDDNDDDLADDDEGEDTEDTDDDDVAIEPDDDVNDTDDADDSGGDDSGGDEDSGDTDDDVGGEEESDGGGDEGGDDVAIEPDDDDGDSGGGEDEGDDNDDSGDDGSSSDDGELTRKRALFSRIEGLYEAMEKYADKLNMLMSNASENIPIYRKACDDLDDLRIYTYDYLIVKFTNASYPESMLFYQRILTALGLIFDDLGLSLSELSKNKDEKEEKEESKPTK